MTPRTRRPREWHAATYDSLPLPHEAWGAGVLDRLALAGDERVLDAGCGTGRDAAALLERWPGVGLVLLDGSERMLERATERLGDRATYVRADLASPLPESLGAFDAVTSVAAFHWIDDHAALFEHLAAVLRPGGRLVAECGGAGNLARMRPALESAQHGSAQPGKAQPGAAGSEWTFADVDSTRRDLHAAGFEVRDVRLREHPLRLEDPDLLDTYLATVVLGAHESRLGPAYGGFVRAVREAMAEPVVDYVRLEIEAVRR